MIWTNNSQRYGVVSQLVHWLSVLFVGIAWLLGSFGDDLPKGEGREFGEIIHVSAGELIGILLIIRLIWLLVSRPPEDIPLPIGVAGKYAGKIAHNTLYGLLFGVVATGLTFQFARGEGLSVFGLYEILSPWTKDRAFAHFVKEIHEFMANALIIVATLHAAAALIHHFIFKDSTLKRMLPSSKNL